VAVVSAPAPLDLVVRQAPPTRVARRLARLARRQVLIWPATALLVAAMRHFPSAVLYAADRWVPQADRRVMAEPAYRAMFADEARRRSATSARAAAQDVALFTRDWGFSLSSIDLPVHIWHGDQDRLVKPVNTEVLAGAIPAATSHLCAGEGHLLFANRMAEIFTVLADAGQANGTGIGRRGRPFGSRPVARNG
jgi:pimeloyl-ACP methyl ester carboxylesterase